MIRLLVAIALLAACRSERTLRKDAGPVPASRVSDVRTSLVPAMPRTDDGATAARALDREIEILAADKWRLIPLLLERAALRGDVEDYERALRESAAFVAAGPDNETALRLRAQTLLRVHRFADAKVTIAELAKHVHPSTLVDMQASLDDATGAADKALAARAQAAKDAPSPQTLTLYAATLAAAGRTDEALALLPDATKDVRTNTPQFVGWLLFQWGRIYEQRGEMVAARDFYRESFARMPGSVETVEHLAGTLIATGDSVAAKTLATAALAENRHPTLFALAGNVDEAAKEWERYVKALPEAFSDHAARFYLAAGKNPKRALELARANFGYRDTHASRALLVEAALAAGDPAGACAVVEPFLTAGTKAERFTAWKALGACGRTDEAETLGHELGI